SAPELEVLLVQHLGDRGGAAVAAGPGELPGGEPRGRVPRHRAEAGIQGCELRFEPSVAARSHTGSRVAGWGCLKLKPEAPRCLTPTGRATADPPAPSVPWNEAGEFDRVPRLETWGIFERLPVPDGRRR